MKIVISFLVLLSFAFAGPASALSVKGSGHIVKETRTMEPFDRIRATGAYELHFAQSDKPELSVETDDNILKHIRTRVIQGELVIDFQPEVISIEQSKNSVVRIKTEKLTALSVTGTADVHMEQLRTGRLRIDLDGAGNITCRQLHAGKLDAEIGGSGNIALAGDSSRQNILISGNGNYMAADLKGGSVRVEISGTGKAEVWAEESLDVTINGVGEVSYKGNPGDVRKTVNGVGEVRKLGTRK